MSRFPRRYESFMDFYRETYETSISRTHGSALADVSLIDLEQGAGDWSDAAHPELVVAQIQSPELKLTSNIGDGVYRGCFRGAHGMIVQPPNAHATIYIDNPHRFHVLAVPYQKLLELAGPDILPADGDFGRFSGMPFSNPELFNLVDNLRAEAEAGNPRGMLYAQGGLMMLATTLARLAQNPPTTPCRGGLAPLALRRCLDAIRDNTEEPSLARLARIAGLSGSHFSRAFKVSTGFSPAAWSMRHRISEAEAALAGSNATIAEIAASCGFANQQHFTTAFKRYTGATPAAWRRERRG